MSMVAFSCTVLVTWEGVYSYALSPSLAWEFVLTRKKDRCQTMSSTSYRQLECSGMSDERYSGGSAGLIYGYLAIWAGTLATFISIAELASM